MKKCISSIIMVLGICLVLTMQGCKPFDVPSFVEVQPNETAFVIPLDGSADKQDMFKSAELLQQKMVATKRIQVTHRWVQEGRMTSDGRYIDTVRVILVNRTPITRTWTADMNSGTSNQKECLESESKDSLEVSSGWTLTAYITPEDASTYLFWYKGVELNKVVDEQIKNSVQSVFAQECSKYSLVELPLHKQDITDSIRKHVIPYYKSFGITLSEDMGFVGGMQYESRIQDAFNKVFESQKAQERAVADKAAQVTINEKELAMAQNAASIIKAKADGDAYAVSVKADAIKKAGDMYIQAQAIDKWNGITPVYSGGGNMVPFVDVTKITATQPVK